MPLPPPPAAAFSSTGNPERSAAREGLGDVVDRPVRALEHRQAGLARRRLGGDLVAHALHHLGDGPTKVTPSDAQASAKAGLWARKP